MAFLDHQETLERLYSLLPEGWFPDLDEAPNLKAVLSMLSAVYSNDSDGLWQFAQYAQRQSRITTAEGFWLDLTALDFFGADLQRHTSESDASYRRRIIINLLAPRGTRQGLVANVGNLTGFLPKVIELRNTGDCGSYSSLSNPVWGGCVYNEIGAYGTMRMPFQLLIQATRPRGEGIASVNGYSMAGGAYATYPKPFGYIGGLRPPAFTWGLGEYVQLTDITGMVTDADIYSTIAKTMPAGCTAWTAISSEFIESPPTGGAMLDSNFFLDLSVLADAFAQQLPGRLFGTHTINMFASGSIEVGADFVGHVKIITMEAVGTMILSAPTTWSGVVTLPAIQMIGRMVATPSFITIGPITASATIFTTNLQPILGTSSSVMPFILGTIPGAQPVLGSSFLLGTNATGEKGAVPAISVQSIAQLGSLEVSVPPGVFSVAAPGTAGQIVLTGVNVSISTLTNLGTSTTSQLGVLAAQGPTLMPVMMPFQLGDTRVAPMVQVPLNTGVESVALAGTVTRALFLTGVNSPATAAGVTAQVSGAEAWSPTRKTSTIQLSSVNLVATQTGTSADPVYGAKSASSGKFYWEVIVSASNLAQITAGIGNASASVSPGQFIGDNANSLGWLASTGAMLVNNSSQATWPIWTGSGIPSASSIITPITMTSTTASFGWTAAIEPVTLCFALDISNGVIYGRVANGNWQGVPAVQTTPGIMTVGQTNLGVNTVGGTPGILTVGQSQVGQPLAQAVIVDPVAGTGGLPIPTSVLGALSPAVTLYAVGDTATGVFAASSWRFTAPSGFGPW